MAISGAGRALLMLCAAGLLAGCTAPPAPALADGATPRAPLGPTPSAPPGGAVVPQLIVVAAPEGFAAAEDVTSSGWRVHLRSDKCALLTHGVAAPSTGDGAPRDLSVTALDAWRGAAGGADAGVVTDVLLTQDGEPTLAGAAPTGVNFVTQDWTQTVGGTERRVRAATRSSTTLRFSGDVTDQTLSLAFQCEGDSIDEAAWHSVLSVVRPDVWVTERETLHGWPLSPHGAS